jgi:hypothetical protein
MGAFGHRLGIVKKTALEGDVGEGDQRRSLVYTVEKGLLTGRDTVGRAHEV